MTSRPLPVLRSLFALATPLMGVPLQAQDLPLPVGAPCTYVEIDAERLACYDAAFERARLDPATADAGATEARQAGITLDEQPRPQEPPPRGRIRGLVSDLFSAEPDRASLDARIANAGRGSLLDSRWELARDSKLGTFNFRAYKPVYLLPAFWSSSPNDLPSSSNPSVPPEPQSLDNVEAKFQLSFKTKAVENLFGDNGDIWMAYTQSSRWQVYDGEQSRAFRESNYEPEIMLVFRNGYALGGWRGRMLGIGVNHQSNGRADPLSRSWNRVVVNVGLDRENWALMLRPWWRLPDGSEDENPGIQDHVGRGDATLVYSNDGHEFSLMARHSLRGGDHSRGAVQLEWGFPLSRTLRGHVQVFDGYGESLIDYNHRATHIGLGISLLEWF